MSYADTILKNGKVRSVLRDNSVITGDAVAIREGVIVKVGTYDELTEFLGPDTAIIDCKGNSVLPGFGDVHCHPSDASISEDACDLFGVYIDENLTPQDTLEEYKNRLREYVNAHPEKGFIRGAGWVVSNFQGSGVRPTRHDIDEICSDKPVVLESFCKHLLWVNTMALEMAGVDRNTPDVEKGIIYREADGFPEGVFKEPEAMNCIKLGLPGFEPSVEEYKEGLLRYQREYANKYGVTMFMDCMHSDNARQAYVELAKEGKLTVYARGVYLLSPETHETQFPEFMARKGTDDVGNDFRVDTIKIFAEGDYKSLEPFDPEYCKAVGQPETFDGGELDWKDEDLIKYIKSSNEAGLCVHIHALADRAGKQAVECISKAQMESAQKGRNAIAHLMLLPDECAEIMGRDGIIANLQMRWMVKDGDLMALAGQFGMDRAVNMFPMRKFLNNGVIIAAGTDFPVTPPPDVMHEIQCAMTRRIFPDAPAYDKYKDYVLGTEKPASLDDALKALTINSAYQICADDYTGSLEEGKSAELVILDSDLESVPVEEIYKIKVHKTIFKGKVVYDSEII